MEFEAAIREAFKQQKHRKCVELIDAASSDVRSSSKYKILKATCLNNIDGQSKRAHQVLDEVISVEPDNAFAHYGKGLVFINEAKLEEAVHSFDQAIGLDSSQRMDKAREMKARVLNMMSPKKGSKKLKAAAVKKPAVVKSPQKSKKGSHDCAECGKSFFQAHNLRLHVITHTGERPYACDVCPKTYAHSWDLSKHKISHNNVASFRCTICLKMFKTEKNLEIHTARHSADVDLKFKCKKCDKGFATERSLSYHARTHSMKRELKVVQPDNESKSEEPSREQDTVSEDADLLEEVEIKDEFGEFEIEAKTEPDDNSSDDGILSSQSLTFGELEPMTEDDSDWSFCVSLLNEMSKMDEGQKKDFRAKTQQTIKDILN